MEKNHFQYPKFVHNLWTQKNNDKKTTFLDLSSGHYTIPSSEAQTFLKFRRYCTGHHDIAEVSKRSSVDQKIIKDMLASLKTIGMLRKPDEHFKKASKADVLKTLCQATELWAIQLKETHIMQEFTHKELEKTVFLGTLLETYHFVKEFPRILKKAYQACSQPELKALLKNYWLQEIGHEIFIEKSLTACGLTPEEVRTSVPLVTTRLITLLIEELFVQNPSAVLLVAKIIEADSFDKEGIDAFKNLMSQKYGLPQNALDSFFEHVKIDNDMGHERLLDDYKHLLYLNSKKEASDILNKLHDIKHAFDAQKIEIKDYYQKEGNYFPRQRVDYQAI